METLQVEAEGQAGSVPNKDVDVRIVMKITGGAAKDGPCPNPKALKPGDAETS